MSRIDVLLGNFPWSWETCTAGAAVSVDATKLRWGRIRDYGPNESFVEGQFNVSA
jgi:hypothetical protein